MSKRNYDDSGDDSDDDSDDDAFLDEEDLVFERIQKRRDPRGPAKPKKPRDGGSGGHSDKPDRRRELASLKAWGAPY
jgi:hypothetical protein